MKAAMALAFCRDCLSWNAAYEASDGDRPQAVIDAANGKWLLFEYKEDVLRAEEEWVAQNRGTLTLTEGWTAEVRLDNAVERVSHPDPCFAILAACVKAKHKLL